MPSDVFVQGCGVVGTGLLTVMLVPQVWQLYRSRNAGDLSHLFLGLFNFGLVMLTLYNVFLKLWVFFVGGLLQLALGMLTQAGKLWADRHQQKRRARLGRALSLRSGARLELRKFAAGSAAPFPLARAAPSYGAQHLLLDVQLPAAAEGSSRGGAAGGDAGPAHQAGRLVGFATVAQLLRQALAAQGLLLRRSQPGSQPTPSGGSGVSSGSSSADGGADEAWEGGKEAAQTELFECHDGYAVLVWHPASCSLSVDCLAVTAQSMRGMAAAAEAFTAALAQRCPGTKAAASSLGRMPAPAAE
ncbi:hypothetical protein ABPG75_011389 [Micractinium tetrahymenae]